ncbi:hypothetical protein [Aquitalea palustris]|uniref:hypothetical protein n=1 Tax=Aquitalea palustris TaxID=2480983 RepID=UPI0011C362A6|nr:hypothetical protein [Aquitalea palustris]
MIYFARAVICPLAIHESRKWLLIKDIFQFKRWRFSFLASESKQLIPYPSFGGEWSLVGQFRRSGFRIRAQAEVNRLMRILTVRFIGDDSRRVSQPGQKHAAARF